MAKKKNKAPKAKVDGRFMKLELVGIFTFLFVFVVSVMVIFVVTSGMEPSTLIISVFGFCGLEGGILGWIKTTKEKKQLDEEKKLADKKKKKESIEEPTIEEPIYPEENTYNENENSKYGG